MNVEIWGDMHDILISWMRYILSAVSSLHPSGCVVYLWILSDSVYANLAYLQYLLIKVCIELTLVPFHVNCDLLRALLNNPEIEIMGLHHRARPPQRILATTTWRTYQ